MSHKKSVLAIAISSVLFGAPAIAQPAPAGTEGAAATSTISAPAVRGKVQNQRGNFLSGAIVSLEGTNRETRTDSQGNFRFNDLAPGTYQVSVDYLGYDRQQASAQVSASSGESLTFTLSQSGAIVGLEEVVVYGVSTRDAQARALNAQRASDNIKSVLSSDYLGRFPDTNVAESMQRLVGASIQRDQGDGRYVNVRGAPLEYANVSIDGVVLPSPDGGTRAIDLDTIPSDVISNLELTKAITPDMDSDAIAGNINIVTQGALDSAGRVLRGNLAGGKNENGLGGDVYRMGFTYGDVLNEEQSLGFLVSANQSKSDKFVDNVEHVWGLADNGQFLAEETEFKDYETTRTRTGISARMDFAPNDDTHFYLSHTYSKFEDEEKRDTLGIEYERYTADSTSLQSVAGRATIQKELRNRTVENTINSTAFGGSHQLSGGMAVDYTLAYTKAEQAYPDRDYFLYREASRPALGIDFTNPDLPRYSVLDGDGQVVRTDFNFAPEDFNWRRYERRFGDAQDKEQSYAINFSIPGQMNNAYSTLKFGAKARLREKFNDEDRFRNSEGEGAPAFSDVIIDRQSLPFGGRYNNGPKFRSDFVSAFGPTLENSDYLPRIAASITSDFDASEDIVAAYGMQKLEWERTSVVYGLRVEHTSTEGSAAEFDDDLELATPLTEKNSYTKWFPSVHLRHELENDVILRAAYSTAISRPNFADLVPYFIVEDRVSGRGSLDIGNPDLDPAYAHNFDLLAEYYIEPLGLISGGIFYKDISDPIFKSRTTLTEGDFAGFRRTRPENGSNGELYGMELNWQQRLDFLPGYWGGLGFIANYTYTESSADLPFGAGKTDLQGTSRDSYNLALQYDLQRFSAQLAYNYRSEYVDSFDTAEPELNVFWDERGTLDLTASYDISDNFTVFLEATNLTDSEGRRYQGNTSRVYEVEKFGESWLIGVRANF